MIKNRLNLIFIVFSILFAAISQPTSVLSQEIIQISENLYVSESISENGESVYFGMEKINASNYYTWDFYKQDANQITAYVLRPLVTGTAWDLTQTKRHILDNSGYLNQTEKNELWELTQQNKRNLYNYYKEGSITAGIAGFSFEENDYIAYASRTPITKKFESKVTSFNPTINLKDFRNGYEDIIMCFRVKDIKNTPMTEHRGIFRNPADLINNKTKHSNISMKLHGFACKVAQQFFEEKKYMVVSPTESMQTIINRTITPENIFIGTQENIDNLQYRDNIISWNEYNLYKINYQNPYIGIGEKPHFIKLEALANYYDANNIPEDFDPIAYINKYVDLRLNTANMDDDTKIKWAKCHYFKHGKTEERTYTVPEDFNPIVYIYKYTDLKLHTTNMDNNTKTKWAKWHYLHYGILEGRTYTMLEDFVPFTYLRLNQDLYAYAQTLASDQEKRNFAIIHFLTHGNDERRPYK